MARNIPAKKTGMKLNIRKVGLPETVNKFYKLYLSSD